MEHLIMLVSDVNLNDYIRGRISGIIYALSGMPEEGYGWMRDADNGNELLCFDCTEEQYTAITATINKLYGDLIEYEFE